MLNKKYWMLLALSIALSIPLIIALRSLGWAKTDEQITQFVLDLAMALYVGIIFRISVEMTLKKQNEFRTSYDSAIAKRKELDALSTKFLETLSSIGTNLRTSRAQSRVNGVEEAEWQMKALQSCIQPLVNLNYRLAEINQVALLETRLLKDFGPEDLCKSWNIRLVALSAMMYTSKVSEEMIKYSNRLADLWEMDGKILLPTTLDPDSVPDLPTLRPLMALLGGAKNSLDISVFDDSVYKALESSRPFRIDNFDEFQALTFLVHRILTGAGMRVDQRIYEIQQNTQNFAAIEKQAK